MSKMSRNKGKRAEREVIDWLQSIINEVCPQLDLILQRNTVQSDRGGSDICGLDALAIELKHVENQSPGLIENWWAQTVKQAKSFRQVNGKPRTPILIYRKNRSPFRVRMEGGTWAAGVGEACIVDIDAEAFGSWFRLFVRELS